MKPDKFMVGIIDGHGGGVGRALAERIKRAYPEIFVRALGTNSTATSAMVKAGADDGATGENAIIFNAGKLDVITGPIGILMANGLLGEVTPAAALAIGNSDAVKVLIPSQKCNIIMAGNTGEPMQYYLDSAVKIIGEELARRV